MKKLILIIALINSLNLFAQQQQQYTQFMYAKQIINPAYTGSNQLPSFILLIRDQWSGLEGAPKTQMLSFNQGLKSKNTGIGFDLIRHSIGVTNTWTLNGNYAYRIKLGVGALGFGIQSSMRYYGVDFSDPRLYATQGLGTDPGINASFQSKYSPNIGTGVYYNTNKYYLGISMPRLLNSDFGFSSTSNSKEAFHGYMMGGLITNLSAKVKFQPQLLLKYASNAPMNFDLNTNFILNDKYTLGATYRTGGVGSSKTGESLDLLLGIQFDSNIMFGLSYDINLSSIRNYTNGSIEAIIRYTLRKETEDEEKYINPRFF